MTARSLILNLKSFIFKFWPIGVLLVLNIILFITNYKSGTYLSGWDNLMPELAPGVNIQRSIFAVWQEYQSLGLLGGMGHASDLIHQLYILLLLAIFPQDLVRYISTFTMLFLGGIGTYFLALYLLKNKTTDHTTNYLLLTTKIPAFLAGIFYTLNIATIQTFYAPFEAFTAHFAALPWLLLTAIIFLKKASIRNALFLSGVLLLATPASYIPTLFVVYILSIGIYILVDLILSKNKKKLIFNSLKLGLIIVIINAFWLLPFLYFTINNSYINLAAKQNQMATETIFLQNKEFGTIQDTALLKGFWFNNVDPNTAGDNAFMLAPWRAHFTDLLVPLAGFALFTIIILGFISCFYPRTKNQEPRTKMAFAILFLFAFTMLATAAFPFSVFDEIFRKIPLFSQAFRFPFTKFSILTALTYSIMLSFGVSYLINFASKLLTTKYKLRAVIPYSIFFILAAGILFIAAPAFGGHMFYEKERVTIPNEYFKTFEYFKNQDTNTRIANLPQPTFWGWTFYNYGMGGSGFLWYGIKQPILDRAFDVWSQNSENYYFELSNAIYSKDPTKLADVLNKYQVSFIILDKNVIYPPASKSLFYPETESLISKIPSIKLAENFGNIKIYKVDLKDKPKSFVFTLPSNLPVVNQPFWNTSDITYGSLGNYISQPTANSQTPTANFPFGSLFSQKTNKEQDYKIAVKPTTIELTKEINLAKKATLNLPDFYSIENIVPIQIIAVPGPKDTTIITGYVAQPSIFVDGKKVAGAGISIPLFSLPANTKFPLNININGVSNFNMNGQAKINTLIGTGFLTTNQDNSVVSASADATNSHTISKNIFNNTDDTKVEIPKGKHTFTVSFPKINDSYLSFTPKIKDAQVNICDGFRNGPPKINFNNDNLEVTTTNKTVCTALATSNLLHGLSYVVNVKSENKLGRPFHFWILNEDQKQSPIDTYLSKNSTNQSFILQPQDADGRSYSFHFDNVSIGQETSSNTLSKLEVFPAPYNFLTNISIGKATSISSTGAQIESVSHPNESLYLVKLNANPQPQAATLALSQSYDKGWHAYAVNKTNFSSAALPFLFGTEVKNHVEVNGWENGWLIEPSTINPQPSTFVIVYLPQYLEYLGFLALFIYGAYLVFKSVHHRYHN